MSLENINCKNELFCFDTQKGLWHKEDDTRMLSTATYNDTMYYVCEENNYVMCPDDENSLLNKIISDNDTKLCGKLLDDGSNRRYGDIDNDGVVTADDLQLLKEYMAGETELEESQIEVADVDGDGSVNVNDRTIIEDYLTKQKLETEQSFEWYCETGDMYDSDFDTKFISKVAIGIKPEKDTKVRVLAKFREDSKWCELYTIYYDEKKPRVIPVPLRRAEFLKLRIEGVGYCEIYGINITYQKGSAVR